MRETERRAREAADAGAGGPRARVPSIHPDLAEALAAAEDALTAALGREVRVQARAATAAASSSTSTRPREAVELAEQLLRRGAPARGLSGLDLGAATHRRVAGRLAQPVRARL